MKKSKLMVRRQTIRILSGNALSWPQGGVSAGSACLACIPLGTQNYTYYATCTRKPSDNDCSNECTMLDCTIL